MRHPARELQGRRNPMINQQEKVRRRSAIEDGLHSAYLEGGSVTDAIFADAEEYIR